jgi:hypothetical protein
MDILLLRVALAPCVVLLVTVAARKLGPERGGRLLGAPATTAPFLLLVALGSGPRAAADSVHGSVAGQVGVAAFCLGYGRLAPRLRPVWACAAALGCLAVGEVVGAACGNIAPAAAVAIVLILAGLLTWPAAASAEVPGEPRTPRKAAGRRDWELPGRMALSGATVFVAVSVAHAAGPFFGGTLSSAPILLIIMSVSIHRSTGPAAAGRFARGALITSLATTAFLLTLAAAFVPLGVIAAFGLAFAAFALTDRCSRFFTDSSAPRGVRPTRRAHRPAVG